MAKGMWCAIVQRNGYTCHQKATFVVGQDRPVYACAQHLATAVQLYRPEHGDPLNPAVRVWRLDRP